MRPHRTRAWILTLCAGLLAPALLAQPPETPPAPGPEPTVEFNFPEEGLDLQLAVEWATKSTGRAFNFKEADIKGKKIFLSGNVRIPQSQVYEFWQSIFVMQGFAMIPMGPTGSDFVVVDPFQTSQIIKQNARFVPAEELHRYATKAGQIIMTTIPVRYVRAENLRGALTQVLPNRQNEIVQEVPSANALLVLGFAPSVYAVYQICQAMDVPVAAATLKFEILRLENAVAEELQPIIADLISQSGAAAARGAVGRPPAEGLLPNQDKPEPKLIADPRTNSIVVYAVESDMNEIKRLIAALDTKVTEVESNIRIYRLKNTNAEQMQSVLRDIIGQSTSRTGRGVGIRPSAPGAGGPTTTSEIGQEVTVVADSNTNSLIITATRTRYEELEPIIRELDRRRPQVLVQAAIAELSDSDIQSIGVELLGIEGGDGYRFGAGTGFGLSSIVNTGGSMSTPTTLDSIRRVPFLTASGVGFSGLAAGIFDNNLNVPILINLLQTNTKVNLLSNASVLTNDNEESRIKVSEQVPTSQNSFDPSGQSRTGFQDYQEAKLELTISPHISHDNYLRLEIHLLVEAFQATTVVLAGLPPPKTTREFQGSVTVPNGKTVVIGGLVQDNTADTVAKVPFFGDIPLLGELFKSTSTQIEKRTLYLFVTPTILSDFKTLEDVSYDRKLEILKLDGNIRFLDPDFRVLRLDDAPLSLEDLDRAGTLDVPRYSPVVPLAETVPAVPVEGIPVRPVRAPYDVPISTPEGGTVNPRSTSPPAPPRPDPDAPSGR
jgi:general secretion pathway protein D